MPNITIVALPEDDEIVWDLSSEKKPHMTLLMLDGPLGTDVEAIVQFVQFAADVSLSRFGLSVDRRGTLGPDDADVLFFDTEYTVPKLREFRAQLLQNDEIGKNYVSSDVQFPGWIPHLTMGYPGAPAKEPKDDTQKYGLKWVNFDRIAVWTDNFDGPEFELKKHQWTDGGAAWSEEYGVHIAHSGVRGMRWGVRRKTDSSGLVTGTVEGAIRSGQTPRAKETLAAIKGGKGRKVSSDHKTLQKNIKKDVSQLSTSEIKDITKRLQAVRELNKLNAEEKAARAGLAKKLTSFALKSVQAGVSKKADSYIQNLVGKQMDGVVPDNLKEAFGVKKQPKKPDTSTQTKTEDAAAKDVAVAELVNEVYQVTKIPKKGD